jgi:alginate O-acetyltransferase complex protein AlgI
VLFPTTTFALFFLLVLPLSWLFMPWPLRWRIFIVCASYVFYSAWNWHFVFLLAGSTVWNQLFAHAIHRQERPAPRKGLLAVAVAGNLALLGWFKYAGFFLSSSHNLLADVGVDVFGAIPSVTLPVGISFFTFCAISYVVEAYRGTFEPVPLSKFAAYLSFFPHLVAGPIVRPWELIPQFDSPRDPRRVDAGRAYYLIATGLFKKVVIANYLATQIVDPVFGAPNDHSSPEVLVAVVAYAVQIYADFSGYTDMAIGIALLLGFQFPQNFDSPYAATSLRDFWRRWHMTLSRWLRDYLYIPLGGSRKGPLVTYRNLMLTMLLGGLWHGAGWTFVAWGGIHGAGLVVERLRLDRRRAKGLPDPPDTALRRATARLLTFSVVCFAWIFFRADSFADARDMIVRLFTDWGSGAPLVTFPVLLAIAAGIGSQYLPARVPKLIMARLAALSPVPQAAVLAAALMVTNAMGPQGVAPFIYFRF